ncbi:hypothetical protein FHU29_000147 [Hoyosella altamirensis]|uniref:Recombinase domain-containing protein n=1 Tax=Hoyosella altamirensis TaxID=616997 RepID=A0A839RHW1_9ACTN|nr:hypothetical protein [Hoyosella altamirensis]
MTGLRDLTARALTTVPTPKRPSKPLGKNTLYKLLTNPYYAGVIRYTSRSTLARTKPP